MNKIIIAAAVISCIVSVYGCPKQCQCTEDAKLSCYRENITSNDLKDLVKKLPNNATTISLIENLLTYFPVELFKDFKSLKELRLSDNHMSVYPQNFSIYIPSLTIIFMDRNKFTSLGANDLLGYDNIENLDLYGNSLTKLDDNVFANAPNLKNLFLEGNKITDISNKAFGNLKKLKKLSLEKNRIANLLPGTFEGLTQLQKLWLNNNSLTSLHPKLFKDFGNAFDIYLANNSITEIEPRTFYKLKLDSVDLSGNQLTTLNKNAFEGTTIYEKVLLDRNPLKCDCHLYNLYQELSLMTPKMKLTGDCPLSRNLTVMDMVAKNPLNCSICTYNPCQNNGTCNVFSTRKYTCTCPFGFRGDNCEEKIMCAVNPCLNNGTCNVLNKTAFSCNCSDEFKGYLCQIEKVCHKNPCHHNGTCVEMSDTKYTCNCTEEYEGKDCESKKGEPGDEGGRLGTGWIILIVVVVIGVILIVIFIVCKRKRKQKCDKNGERIPLSSAKV